jgi:hypothetical protein
MLVEFYPIMNKPVWKFAICACTLLLPVLLTSCLHRSESDTKLLVVDTVDLSAIDPALFSEEEWFIPPYLKNFSTVANSVLDTGTNKGFINIAVWRTPDVNKPYNARIMESILSLVWFYTQDKPWNPYYNDPAIRKRIESALTFWCSIQNGDGRFSEYAPQKWSLAPTAFATKFVGRALYLLEEEKNATIDPPVLAKANDALRKALFISFTHPDLWEHGRNFTNQYANLWGGAMMYLQHHPDNTIDQLLTNRLDQSMSEFQSPCGYFYEKNGPDWGYNLSTHHSDLQVAWHFARETRLQDYFTEQTELWYDWFSYNAVKEPGSARYYLNKGVETRQQRWYLDTDVLDDPASARWTPQAEFVPMARAFALSKEEYATALSEKSQQMRDQYPMTDKLRVGEFWAFSPYTFLHYEMNRWLPSREQKDNAIKNLPYLKNENFTEVRSDRRNVTDYSFVRRPSYYAIFNSGNILTEQQRYGLGLVWNPIMGCVLQSQSASDIAAWGTRAVGESKVYEAQDVVRTFYVNNQPWNAMPGANTIDGELSISYPLAAIGKKTISFKKEMISVNVHHKGPFLEVIPLLVEPDATLMVDDSKIVLKNKGVIMVIDVQSPATVTKTELAVDMHGGKPCQVFEIRSVDRLKYEIRLLNQNP